MLRLNTLGRLWIDGNTTAAAAEVRPRRLALLAILAAAGTKGISREQVLAILWTESEPERARHSLSQTLYSLRRDLGVEVVNVTPNLRLDPAMMTSDVDDFRVAIAEKNWERAAELFGGPFLDGFYLTDAPQFERWADEERSGLSHDALRAIESAARTATGAGQAERATEYWRRLTRLDPVNGRFASAYIEALVARGDRIGALLHAQSHAEVVRRELELEPDAEILRFIDSARDTVPAVVVPKPRQPAALLPASAAPVVASELRSVNARRSFRMWGGVAALVLVVAVGVMWRGRAARSTGADGSALQAGATRSPLANRLYDEGLRAFYQSDAVAASRLFNAALKEDSNFVLATYFAWRSEYATNGPRQDALADRAVALAAGAPERDRLLILAHVSAARSDLSAVAAAESLAARYANDPEALIRAADVATDLPRVEALLDRAIAVDSATGVGATAVCRLCDAFNTLARRYAWADSVKGVEETLDRWSALRPDDYEPWRVRADYLIGLGRSRDADAALRRADSLGAPHASADSGEAVIMRALRLDDFDSSNKMCGERLATPDPDEFARYRSLCTIGLRMQGRYREALGLIRGGRVPWSKVVRGGLPLDRTHAAILDMEMGRPAAAAFAYAGMATEVARSSFSDGYKARMLALDLTLSATASALGGDTVRVRALVDSVELVGHRSLYPRDPLLHHFLRGLLLSEAGEHEQAVREYRAAIWSPSEGYTRINYEMGKSLLALNRPTQAIPVLRAALRGGLDGSGLYLTRTEVHELVAQAFVAAGQRDSATFHYGVVERAWRSADPLLSARYDVARQWLLRAGRSVR